MVVSGLQAYQDEKPVALGSSYYLLITAILGILLSALEDLSFPVIVSISDSVFCAFAKCLIQDIQFSA